MQITTTSKFSVDRRYAGLPGIVLGGYSSGLIARELGSPGASVRLRRPVPLEQPLELVPTEDGLELRSEGTVLVQGAPGAPEIEVPAAPGLPEAEAASRRFPGHRHHPYHDCFACGPNRASGDGLRVFAGPVAGRELVAAPWTPEGKEPIGPELVWSAFDCVQLWSLMTLQAGSPGERMVTVGLAGESLLPIEPGRPYVVYGWPLPRNGSKLQAGAALAGPDGTVYATGLQTAVTADWGVPLDFVDPADFGMPLDFVPADERRA